ncbi:MAG: ferrochelatase [Phycisphaerae bacterium]|nr:ferrochelatase [Phycisphaerae bacterium]
MSLNFTGESHPGAGRSEPSRRTGVLLVNLGTPDGPDVPSVRRYLAEFLSDPDVISLPRYLRWMNKPLGHMIARFRAPQSAEMYHKVWSEAGSPLSSITNEQVLRLAEKLPSGWRVYAGMRYGNPSIAATLRRIAEDGVDDLIVMPMYPQYSETTTGTALREMYRALERGRYGINVSTRNTWYDDGGYIHAQAGLIADYAQAHALVPEDTVLLFSAHGLPVAYVNRGDPYPRHIQRSIDLIREHLGWPEDRVRLGYQSRLGPVEWLRPATDDLLKELIGEGNQRILVCPISFTTDCLETLEEIDVRYREIVEAEGGDLYLCPALNAYGPFIDALKNLVTRGPRPVSSWGARNVPLLAKHASHVAERVENWIDTLVVVGVSLDNPMGSGCGPDVGHADPLQLHCVKKSQAEMPDLLRQICANGVVREGFVWNTCHRFEFYGWVDESRDMPEGDCLVARVRRALFNGGEHESLAVNVLVGAEAWHHLVRTVVGLNSGLPGDADIIEQLETAQRLAERTGTAGPLVRRLVSEAVRVERLLRRETVWGRFNPGYCYAALSKVAERKNLDFASIRTVVVGGSSTSRSVLSTLIQRFDVPSRHLTLVYRGHSGGQIKALRKAIQNGKRVRVHNYDERVVYDAIRAADMLVLGVDRDEPILHARDLRGLRDYAERPLTVLDFNTFGSTEGIEAIPGVRVIHAGELEELVGAFASDMCASESFRQAVDEAEHWIVDRIPEVDSPRIRPHACHEPLPRVRDEQQGSEWSAASQRWRKCVRCTKLRIGQEVDQLERSIS